MNDIFCPNTTYTAADGTTYTVLDTANCSVGADGSLPPHELFAREGYDRYTQMEIDGKQFYVYNDETKANNSSWYKLGNVSVNPKLAAQVTLMPSYKQDGAATILCRPDYKGVVSRESIHQPKGYVEVQF